MILKMHLALGALVTFIFIASTSAQNTQPATRLDPSSIASIKPIAPGAGTSGVSGILTRVLKGDPSTTGLYAIELTVPANTRIEAHSHPDDRVATVVSGTWYIGYGNTFDIKELKALPPGSFYTEPPSKMHFARTGSSAVVLLITGIGPTGTEYFEKK